MGRTRRTQLLVGIVAVGALAAVAVVGAGSGDDDGGGRGAGGEAEQAAAAGDLEEVECAGAARAVADDIPVECHRLWVPEDADDEDGRLLELQVVVLGERSDDGPPLLHLHGGPGVAPDGIVEAFGMGELEFAELVDGREVVVLAQRGVGRSEPSLRCTALGDPVVADVVVGNVLGGAHSGGGDGDGAGGAGAGGADRALAACADELEDDERVDLDAFDTAASAGDVALLVEALGVEEVDLWGTSYGTRLALTVMRDHPDIVRSVVLDSVLPLHVDPAATFAPAAVDALEAVFAACEADASCAAENPDLAAVFDRVTTALNDKPAKVEVELPDGTAEELPVDGATFVLVVRELLGASQTAPFIPTVITRASRGDLGPVARFASARMMQMPVSTGAYLSVMCQDEHAFTDARAVEEAATAVPASQRAALVAQPLSILEACRAWPVERSAPEENDAVRSDIPTLILAGQFDPTTPPAWGREAAEGLSRNTFVELAGLSHGVVGMSPCATAITVDFLGDPTGAPDTSCAEEAAPRFPDGEQLDQALELL